MYLHLGQETAIRSKEIIGIFDIENTSVSKYTKEFLSNSAKNHKVYNVSFEMPKTFIVSENDCKNKLYISQISSRTLLKRSKLDMHNID